MKRLPIRLGVFLILLIASLGTQAAVAQQQGQDSVLVSAKWLEKQLKSNSNLILIDLPFRKTNYGVGHIPGAVMLDWRKDIIDTENVDLYRLPQKDAFEKLMSTIGVKNDSLVVLTDDMSNRASVRMFYTLKYFGHQNVKILNGGTPIWKAAGLGLTTDVAEVTPSQYKVKETREDFFVQLEAVQKAINSDCQLIDGRPAPQFSGAKPGKAFHNNQPHKRLGHIPTAKNVPWNANLNSDGTFKSIDELKQLYQDHGIDTDADVVTYCNEGLHAAMPWFVFRELFGHQGSRVYDDSMAQWANRDDTPLEKAKR